MLEDFPCKHSQPKDHPATCKITVDGVRVPLVGNDATCEGGLELSYALMQGMMEGLPGLEVEVCEVSYDAIHAELVSQGRAW